MHKEYKNVNFSDPRKQKQQADKKKQLRKTVWILCLILIVGLVYFLLLFTQHFNTSSTVSP